MVSTGVRPSGPVVPSPARMRRFNHAMRTMKNSSRFELKMARNFTRSSKGTLGSWASSSTRRLNSSQDSSRLTKASVFTLSPPVERLAQQDAVAHAACADHEPQIAAVEHRLLDDDGPGQDDVGALILETADLRAPAPGRAFQPLANGGDVRLVKLEPMPVLALAAMGAQVDAGQRADGAAETDHDIAAPGGRHDPEHRGANAVAEYLELAGGGRIVAQEAPRGPHSPEGKARDGEHLATPHAAELQARAAEVRDDAVLDGEAREGGRDAQPCLVPRAQDLHVDALVVAQGCQEPLAVPGVPHRRGRHREDAWTLAIAGMAREEAMHGPERAVDRVTGQRAGRAIAEPRRHSLLSEDVIADAGHDPDKAEADGRRSEIDDRHQVRRQTTSADVSF